MSSPKPRVHFSKADAERKELSSSNYNRPAAAFKPQQFSQPTQFNPQPSQFNPQPPQYNSNTPTQFSPDRSTAVFSPVSNQSPVPPFSPPNLPLSPRSTRKVATPKFNAAARTQAWTPGGASTTQPLDSNSLAKSLEQQRVIAPLKTVFRDLNRRGTEIRNFPKNLDPHFF